MKKYKKKIRGWKSEGEHMKRKALSVYLRQTIKEDFGIHIKLRPTIKS